MSELEQLLGLFVAAVILAAGARRVGAPYPVFLALGGALLAFVPVAPPFTLPPELALALFVAVGAVAAGGFSLSAVAPTFLLAVAGSVVAGPALGWITLQVMDRVQHVPTAIILQFVSTFGVWILAEHLGLSGVLTVVCYAMTVAQTAPERRSC